MHVITGGTQVAAPAFVDDERLVTSAEEVPEEFVAAVEAAGVGAKEPFHANDEIGLGRFGDQMKMIAHEAPGVELPAGFFAGFTEGIEEAVAILVVVEDGFTPVPTIHQVIDGSGKLNAQRSRHELRTAASPAIVNC